VGYFSEGASLKGRNTEKIYLEKSSVELGVSSVLSVKLNFFLSKTNVTFLI
jgi:hypothetical protein